MPDSLYSIDYARSLFISKQLRGRVLIEYNVFPINFSLPFSDKKNVFLKRGDDSLLKIQTPFDVRQTQDDNSGYLLAEGNISRGISVGNNQGVLFNSTLNLQLKGALNNNIMLEGAISDNNLPIQPEGNTQQLQDFENVYLKMYSAKQYALLGDFELQNTKNTFLRYNKKVQGISLFAKNDSSNIENAVSVAISKGKNCRKNFVGIEGNQGPYRLTGCENELYIIVLSNTERVYVDGRLLSRGYDKDYIIDYNSGEIIFTPEYIITKDSRIVVEFEYSEKNYARMLVATNHMLKTEKTRTTVSLISETDNKNQPFQQSLNAQRIDILKEAGDNTPIVPSAMVDTVWNENKIYYLSKDTLVKGLLYENIFELSRKKETDIYLVTFSFVGANGGDYVLDISGANGKSYKWIAPTDGMPMGQYSPVITLVAPQKKQVVSLKHEYNVSKTIRTEIEITASNNDKNSFSHINDNDNRGVALNYTLLKRWNIDSSNKYLETGFTQKMIASNFDAFNEYRDIEYNRDWGILQYKKQNEYLSTFNVLYKKHKNSLNYLVDILNLESNQNGIKHSINGLVDISKVSINTSLSSMKASYTLYSVSNSKYNALCSYNFKKQEIGVETSNETIEIENWNKNLQLRSEKYYSNKMFLSKKDSLHWWYKVSVEKRLDYMPDTAKSQFSELSDAINYKFQIVFLNNYKNNFRALLHYRTIDYKTNTNKEQHFISKFEHQVILFKKVISANTDYQYFSGLESKKMYSFIEVAPGTGYYYWNEQFTDYNKNGKADINEFEIARNKYGANYVKIMIPTSEYIPVYQSSFGENVIFNPKYLLRNSSFFGKILSRFENNLYYKTTLKTNTSSVNGYYNGIADSNFISNVRNFSNIVYFNKNKSGYSSSFHILRDKNKISTINGWETSNVQKQLLKNRLELSSFYILTFNVSETKKSFFADADFLENRTYNINSYCIEPIITWQPSMKYALDLFANIEQSKNLGKEHALKNTYGKESRISINNGLMLTLSAKLIQIKYSASSNNSLSYIMLDGFRPGKNIVCEINVRKSFGKYLKGSIEYYGQKSDNIPFIHYGNIQLSAYF